MLLLLAEVADTGLIGGSTSLPNWWAAVAGVIAGIRILQEWLQNREDKKLDHELNRQTAQDAANNKREEKEFTLAQGIINAKSAGDLEEQRRRNTVDEAQAESISRMASRIEDLTEAFQLSQLAAEMKAPVEVETEAAVRPSKAA